jgi:uncharacterized membrane-anchored protein
MNDVTKQALSKVPAVTLGFWVIKILATTLGETGGDTVTMTLAWGYLAGVTLFGGVLVALVVAQISAKRFYRILYWATIVASTTFGTTLADFADRSLGIGYTGGSLLLLSCLLATLGLWHWSEGTVSVNTVSTPKVETFYWATITFSQRSYSGRSAIGWRRRSATSPGQRQPRPIASSLRPWLYTALQEALL